MAVGNKLFVNRFRLADTARQMSVNCRLKRCVAEGIQRDIQEFVLSVWCRLEWRNTWGSKTCGPWMATVSSAACFHLNPSEHDQIKRLENHLDQRRRRRPQHRCASARIRIPRGLAKAFSGLPGSIRVESTGARLCSPNPIPVCARACRIWPSTSRSAVTCSCAVVLPAPRALLEDTGIALPELAKIISLLLHAVRIGLNPSACATCKRA